MASLRATGSITAPTSHPHFRWARYIRATLIVDIQKRRYLLRNNAIEIFFADHRSYLFDLPKGTRKKILAVLSKAVTNGVKVENSNLSPSELLKKSGYTGKWQRREISNFEYLMILNTFAGRTYNDLTQCPVFPWVLKDFVSPTLDLNSPESYRYLSKPIGAINKERLRSFWRERTSWTTQSSLPSCTALTIPP